MQKWLLCNGQIVHFTIKCDIRNFLMKFEAELIYEHVIAPTKAFTIVFKNKHVLLFKLHTLHFGLGLCLISTFSILNIKFECIITAIYYLRNCSLLLHT